MAIGSPDYTPKILISGSNDEQLKVSVSDSDSTGTFAQEIKSYLIFNDGPKAVHVKRDAEATVNNFLIPSKSWIYVDLPVTVLHFICATGETATVYLWGVF
ncbi:hypothetical protein LCGC14_3148860 [marine sediment metagenome]|uniref:Uncharacterized protein n=1 Tax=marine sediment metagenome TaxID=412755 RepID=A0A0F8VUS5_9ZZZZ